MKLVSSVLNALIAMAVLTSPMQAAPKASEDQKKRAQAAAKANQGAVQRAPQQSVPQRPVAKAPSRPQPVARPAPQRAPVMKAPQRPVAKAPSRPAQVARPAPQRSVQQRAPQRPVVKAPSQPKPAVNRPQPARVPERATVERSQRQAAQSAARIQADRQAEARQARAQAQAQAQARAQESARTNVAPMTPAPARDRSPARGRDLVRSQEDRAPRIDQDIPKTAAAARAATAEAERGELRGRAGRADQIDRSPESSPIARDLDNRPGRAVGREGRLNQEAQRAQDLAGNVRAQEAARNRDGARDGRVRNFSVDRRPAPLNTTEERQNRAARTELRERAIRDRKREIAQRAAVARPQVERFRENRQTRLGDLQAARRTLRTAAIAQTSPQVIIDNRQIVRNYWGDRGTDIRYRIADRRDYLFNDSWWEGCHWRDRHVHVSNPWWWWQPARWSTLNVFFDTGWSEPIVYDYGTDVIYDDRAVYVRGELVGTPVEYSRQVIELANPVLEAVGEAPVDEAAWTPLGVWALVQENQGDAVMFFQLSVDKEGIISGAYSNVVSGEALPVSGRVDRVKQRAAWHIGDQTEKVFEAGMSNLTEDQASCLVHVAPGEMQTWLLVRMEGPELPTRPADVSPASSASAN